MAIINRGLTINDKPKNSTLNTYAPVNGSALGNVGVNNDKVNSTKPSLGTYHMAMASNLYEIQRSNNFEFVVDFNAGENYNKSGNTGNVTGDAMQEVIRMSVSQVSIPHFSQEPIPIKRGNTTIKYAGVPTFSDGNLTLNDYIGANTLAMLMAWQNLSYNVATEKVGLATDYKKQATLIEYSPDLQKVRSWILYGCWITNITEGELNSEDNSKHTIQVTISYDKAVLEDA